MVVILDRVGGFAEDKDAAAEIRESHVRPSINAGGSVVLDFSGVSVATQSFVHALISDILRTRGEAALEQFDFKGCSLAVRGIVETVVQYSLETMAENGA